MLDFLRRNGPSPKQIDRAVKRLTEPHGEAGPRIEAAEKLADWGTPEALFGLVKRFSMSSRVITQDIEEKRMVVDILVSRGDAAVGPLLRFMKSYPQVDWPVQALARIVSRDALIRHLVEAIEEVAQSEFAPPEHRVSLIKAVQGYVTPEMGATLSGFLEDADDDVRIVAIEALAEIGEQFREQLLETFLAVKDRPRIRRRIAEIFADNSWDVKGFRPRMEESLPEGFALNAKGVIRRL